MTLIPHGPTFSHGEHAAIDSLWPHEWAQELCDSLSEYGMVASLSEDQREEAERLTRRLIDLFQPDHWTEPNPWAKKES